MRSYIFNESAAIVGRIRYHLPSVILIYTNTLFLHSAATPYSYMRAHRRGDCQVYTVQSGDWCDKIATSNGISLVQLQQFNPSLNCNTIAPGDRLCLSWGSLPAPPSSQPNPDGTCKTATVQPGDWCDKIATGNGITLQQLQQYNSALNCAAIIAGKKWICDQSPVPRDVLHLLRFLRNRSAPLYNPRKAPRSTNPASKP